MEKSAEAQLVDNYLQSRKLLTSKEGRRCRFVACLSGMPDFVSAW